MTFREVKVAEFEYFPVFFPDNRELWEKVFSRGRENTRKEVENLGKVAGITRARSRAEVLLAISRELRESPEEYAATVATRPVFAPTPVVCVAPVWEQTDFQVIAPGLPQEKHITALYSCLGNR